MKSKVTKISKNGTENRKIKTKINKVIATLSTEDLKEVVLAKVLLEKLLIEQRLLVRGNNAFWFGLKDKYKLPTEFNVNWATGEISRKKEVGR